MKKLIHLNCAFFIFSIFCIQAYAASRSYIDNLYKMRLGNQTEYNSFVHRESFIRYKLEAGLKIARKVSQSIVDVSGICNEYQNLDQLDDCLRKLNSLTFSLSSGAAQVQTQVDYFSSPDKNLLPEYQDHLDLLKTWILYANNLKNTIENEIEKISSVKSELIGLEASKRISQIRNSVKSDSCLVINEKISNQLFAMESQLMFTYLNKMVPAFIYQFNRLSKFVGFIKGFESTCQNLNQELLNKLYLTHDSWMVKYRTVDKGSYVAKVCKEIQASQPDKYSSIYEYCRQQLKTDNFLNTIWQINRKRTK